MSRLDSIASRARPALLAACLGFAVIGSAAAAAPKPDDIRFDQRLGSQVSLDLAFRDETGKPVTLRELMRDKPVVLSLVYYQCPMLCTLVLNGLTDSLKQIPFTAGQEFDVWTLSFNHEETHVLAAAKKATYLEAYGREGAETGWRFLVGDEEPIAKLCEAVGFGFEYLPEAGEYAHKSGIILLTPEGKVSRYFAGVEYDPTSLRLGLVEASENRIGGLIDKIFLLCYHYDPVAGKYGLVIQRVVNAACMVTLVVLLGGVAVLFRQERRTPGAQAA